MVPNARSTYLLCALALASVAEACSLDRRHLELASDASAAGAGDGDTGGSSASVAGGTGTGAVVGGGGDGSAAVASPPLVDGCADLDTDRVADCTVTLVENPTFASDVEGWRAGEGASLTWDSRNALLDTPSGCALVRAEGRSAAAGSALVRASQCVGVPGGQLVIAYANAWVEAPATGQAEAQAELEVSYFDAADCAGQATGYFVTPPSERTAAWVTVQAGGVPPATTKSVLVELVGVKPNGADELLACFDNVMLKLQRL